MRRTPVIWLLLLALLIPQTLKGQADTLGVQGFLRGWHVGAAGGVNSFFYWGSRGFRGHVQPDGELLLGKAFSPYAGVRLGLERGGMSYDAARKTLGYVYLHGDVLWDATQTFGGLQAQRPWSLSPYMHFGLLGLTDGRHFIEREYASGVGLLATWRIIPRLSATLDLRTSVYTGAVGRGTGHLGSVALLGGLRWDLDQTGVWGSAQPGGLLHNGFGSNWFISALGGAYSTGSYRNFRWKGVPVGDVTVGKWFTPAFALRGGWQGNGKLGYVHGDVLWNVLPYGADGRWSTGPYLHMGFRYGGGRAYAGGIGWFGGVRLTRRLGLQAEVRGFALNGNTMAWSVLGGLTYRLGTPGWERYLPDGPTVYGGLEPWRQELRKQRRELLRIKLTPHPDRHKLKKAGEAYRIGRFQDNWSAGLALGTTNGALAADLSLTKWVLPQMGGRLGYQGISLQGKNGRTGYSYLHQDLLLNVVDLLAGYSPTRRARLAPYLHFGVIAEYNSGSLPVKITNFEYATGAGVLGTLALDGHLGLTAEYRMTLLTGDVSMTGSMRATSTVLVGLEYAFGPRGWKPVGTDTREGLRMGRFWDNWFLSGAAGVNGLTGVKGGTPQPGLGADLTLGKWITPQFGLRGGLQGIRAARLGTNPYNGVAVTEAGGGKLREELGFAYVHGDFLWNVSQTVLPYRDDRLWSLVPYAHMGALVEYGVKDAPHRMFERELAAGVGLLNNFRLGQDADLFLDTRVSVLRSQASGDKDAGAGLLPSLLLGVSGRLGAQGFTRDAASPASAARQREGARHALSLNLGDGALGAIGLSAQWAPARHWSLEGTFRPYGLRQSFGLGGRWWPWHVYSGWYVRSAVQVENIRRGGLVPYLADDFSGQAYGLVLDAGYSLLLSRSLNLEVGLGAYGGRRQPNAAPGAWQWFVGPNAVTLALVWVL